MVDVTRTFTVNQSGDAVLEYLRDFSRAEEWDPGTVSCTRLDSGPVAVGSRWRNVSKFLGKETELRYELTRLEADRVQFVGKNDTATSTDDISVKPGAAPGTTSITYHAHIEFHGLAKLAGPVAKVAFEKLGNETEENLVRILGTPAH
ncbi:MAG: SRPBCC family protein [Actinomycetota bacterium]|nr:SRPBCC family protein [Actinomycetota bacterium]